MNNSNYFAGLAVLNVDLLGMAPADLMYIAQKIAEVAKTRQDAIDAALKKHEIDEAATVKAEAMIKANGHDPKPVKANLETKPTPLSETQ